jgi:alkanesulfonate monooxygenase SsuD/methylene tetrahydromethanopterin reductase-like flavin-dependent oxidoreductase (luciferase family)
MFGVMLYPDQPIGVLIERIAWLESLGFDQVFLPDHSGNLRNRRGVWFDSWAVLAAAAVTTRRYGRQPDPARARAAGEAGRHSRPHVQWAV